MLMQLCGLYIFTIAVVTCQNATDFKNLRTQIFDVDGYDKRIRPTNNQSEPIAGPMLMQLCGLYIFTIAVVTCQNATDFKNLRTQIFDVDGYDKRIRPTNNQSEPIVVTLSYYLLAINGLSEATETLTTTGYLLVGWTDEFLQWDPDDYGGITKALWPQDEVWKPDVALQNSVQGYKELGVPSLNVDNFPDGEVKWYPFEVFQSTCTVDNTYFPFDVQTCELEFVAWSYTVAEVILLIGNESIYLPYFKPNSEWNVVDTNAEWSVDTEEDGYISSVTLELKLKRKPMFVFLTVIMPIIMLAALNICVFVLPCDSGEKSSFAITVFLAFAVFLTIVSSILPRNSDTVALFSVFLFVQTVSSTLITIIALVMIRYSARDDSVPVPRYLSLFLRTLSCRPCSKRSSKVDNCEGSQLPVENVLVDANSKRDTLDNHYTWKEAINVLDKICFLFFCVLFVTSAIVCFARVHIASGK